MTDTTTFLTLIVTTMRTYVDTLNAMKGISDRIGADSGLTTATATKAQTAGRTDLSTADFDNMKSAIDAIVTLMNLAGASASPPVNAATVKLALYKLL